MSVYGGDSWAREAQQQKRRVDDLAIEGLDGSSYRKLSNGKFACLVCPNCPVLDSLVMLSDLHFDSEKLNNVQTAELSSLEDCTVRDRDTEQAEFRLKERELTKRDEINKRIALSGDSSVSTSSRISVKPLLEQTRLATSQVLSRQATNQDGSDECPKARTAASRLSGVELNPLANVSLPAKEPNPEVVAQQHVLDFRESREKELKITSAGWKRDGNGRWYKDENVEFDSDEEDPNVCLA